jgi:2-hydroxychromene-2-carboxylate isomerase
MSNNGGKTIEFMFDFGSPTTYLAYWQVPKVAAECGAEVVWRPILLGGVFRRPATQARC